MDMIGEASNVRWPRDACPDANGKPTGVYLGQGEASLYDSLAWPGQSVMNWRLQKAL